MQDKTLIHLREWLAQGDCARVAEGSVRKVSHILKMEVAPQIG